MTDDAGRDANELLFETSGRLRILTLNRPDRLNALTPELHHALRAAVADAAADPAVGAVVLTGAGRGFCSGGDVQRGHRRDPDAEPETLESRADALRGHGGTPTLLKKMPKPTIALVNGAAAGSGLALALACDIRIAARSAVFRTAYARVGLSGDLGVSHLLLRAVGVAKARELMLLNRKIEAEEACALGLVQQVVDDARLIEEGLAMATELAAGPTVAFRYMKQNLDFAETATFEQSIEREAYNSVRCARTQDVKEASAAFHEKRAPNFIGR